MILSTVNQSLQVTLGGVPASPWPYTVDTQDTWRIPSGQVTTASFHGTIPSIAPVTVAPAPSSTLNTRLITNLTIMNGSGPTLPLSIQLNDTGTLFTYYVISLDKGDTLTYQLNSGFQVVNAAGQVKTAAVISASGSSPVAVQLSDGTVVYDLASVAPLLRALYAQGNDNQQQLALQTGTFVPYEPSLPIF